jgi:hypothetical protein
MVNKITFILVFFFLSYTLAFTQIRIGEESEEINEKLYDLTLTSFSDVPEDIEDITTNIRLLENYRQSQLKLIDEIRNFKRSYLTEPTELTDSWFKNQLSELDRLMKEFDASKSEELFYRIEVRYNELVTDLLSYNVYSPSYNRRTFRDNEELFSLINNANYESEKAFKKRIGKDIYNLSTEYFIDYSELNEQAKILIDKIKFIKENLIFISKAEINGLYNDYKNIYVNIDKEMTKSLENASTKLNKIEIDLKNHKTKKRELNRDINEWGIIKGLPWFCATVIILFLATVFSKRINNLNFGKSLSPHSSSEQEHLSKVLLEVITVLLLTLTILILGLSNILKENVLGTLIGGIAGYILNKTRNLQNENGNGNGSSTISKSPSNYSNEPEVSANDIKEVKPTRPASDANESSTK